MAGAAAGGVANHSSPAIPLECQGSHRDEPSTQQSFKTLTAKLVDQDGKAAGLSGAQACGFDLCLYGTVDSTGTTTITFDKALQIRGPAFKYGFGLEFAQLAYPIPDQPVQDLGEVAALRLPPMGSGQAIAAGTSSRSSGVELDLAPGADLKFDTISYPEGDERQFRAQVVETLASPAVDPSLGLELLVGTTPVGTTFCPLASLTVDNQQQWAPGTEVTLFMHGVKLEQKFAPFGGWQALGTAEVSKDGQTIRFESMVPYLSTFGLKRTGN